MPSGSTSRRSPSPGLAGGNLADYRVDRAGAPPLGRARPRGHRPGRDARPPTVEAAIRRHGGPLLRDVALFDIYRGQPLAETDKSLAYRLTLRDDERTLTEAELDAAVAAVMTGLTDGLGARFRT